MTESTSPVQVPVAGGSKASPRAVLVIVCAGVVLASLDLFIVNVALPQIARDLGARNLGQLSWVLNGYAIVYASLLVFFGKLADRYRRDPRFPRRGGRVHRGLGGLCRVDQRRHADRFPHGPSRGRRC